MSAALRAELLRLMPVDVGEVCGPCPDKVCRWCGAPLFEGGRHEYHRRDCFAFRHLGRPGPRLVLEQPDPDEEEGRIG